MTLCRSLVTVGMTDSDVNIEVSPNDFAFLTNQEDASGDKHDRALMQSRVLRLTVC